MSTARLLLRPFGYLGLAVVWLALVAIVLLVGTALPSGVYPLSESVIVERLANGSVVDGVGTVLLTPLLGAAFGILVMVLVASAVQVLLCLLYVARSLNPAYSDDQLSASGSSDIGPYGGTAISLLPVWSTPYSDFLMRLNAVGWGGNRWSFLGQSILGVAYLVGALSWAWPLEGAASIVWIVITAAIAAVGLVFYVRGVARVDLH